MPPERPNILSEFLAKITRRISLNKRRGQRAEKRGSGMFGCRESKVKTTLYRIRRKLLALIETERILSIESWGEIIEERGWSTDTFAIVYVEYYTEYDHTLTPLEDGYTAMWLWMEKSESTGDWLYYDGMMGIHYRGIFKEAE